MESWSVLDSMISEILFDINMEISGGLLDTKLEYWRMGIYVWEPSVYLW